MECQNVLFIYTDSLEKKHFFMEKLKSQKLFETFIPLSQSKLECYGTSSDVYIEYVEVEYFLDNIIKLTFYTYLTPCIDFSKKLASRYNVNVELIYYNQGDDFSGKIQIYRNQVVRDEKYSFWQGLYLNDTENFWINIYSTFNIKLSFMEFILQRNLHILDRDFNKLNYLYDDFLLSNLFEKNM